MWERRKLIAGSWSPGLRTVCLGILATLGSASLHGATPISDLARTPEYREIMVSPGGGYLTVTRRHDAEDYLLILDSRSMRLLYSANFGDSEIGNVWWVNDDRLVLQAGYRLPGIADDTELIGINADGSKRKRLLRSLREDLELLSVLQHDRKKILIAQREQPGGAELPIAYELDVYSGALREIARARHLDGRFVTDLQGNIAFVHGRSGGNGIEVFHRSEPAAQFRLLPATISKDVFVPKLPAGAVTFFTLLLRTGQTDQLVRWNPASGEATLELEHSDLESAIFHSDPAGVVFAVEYHGGDGGFAYLDGSHPMAVMHRAISGAFSGSRVIFTSATNDLKRAVAHVGGAVNPGAYYFVDLENGTLSELFAGYPWLQADLLAGSRATQIPVMDGQEVPARLTVPQVEKAEARPAVVLVGDELMSARFDWRSQLLAAKGYAVLALSVARSKDQARAKQDGAQVIVDATRWLIDQEIAQSGRVCTFGTGNGGFAALSAVARAPELFRCVVGDRVDFGQLGDVEAIGADVMLAYADGDTQARRLIRSLAGDDVPVEQWLIQPSDDDRIGFYHNAIAFLDQRIYPDHPARSEDDAWDGSEDLVCEKIAEVGTRVKRRVCRTRQQMDVEQRRAREEIKYRQGMQSGGGADG